MQGLELDIYLPKYKVAIEYHGLAHHSERPIHTKPDLNKIKTQHETKYLLAKKEGVKLIQIFEDEWRDKKAIVQSMLASRLGMTKRKTYARKCKVVELATLESKEFFDTNHIAGSTSVKMAFGLRNDNDELICAVSVRKTWNKHYGYKTLEIARFASRRGEQVLGGFTKLFKVVENWALDQGFERILTYADCRFSQGKVYLTAGFTHAGKTKPNYFYENGYIRENRFKHRKSFTSLVGNTERDQQNALGWFAIYDAGSEIYTKSIIKPNKEML